MVRAQTIDFGPPISGNVTTGPQEGSPMAPSKLGVTKTVSSVELQWTNGASGKGPILGYYIETRRKGKYNGFLYTLSRVVIIFITMERTCSKFELYYFTLLFKF